MVSVWSNKNNCNSGLIYIKANQIVVHNPIHSPCLLVPKHESLNFFVSLCTWVPILLLIGRTAGKKIELISQYGASLSLRTLSIDFSLLLSEFDRYWQPWEKRYSSISPLSSLSGFENKGNRIHFHTINSSDLQKNYYIFWPCSIFYVLCFHVLQIIDYLS